jgi:hypothetical protein
MQKTQRTVSSLIQIATIVVLMLGLTPLLQAADITGTWVWSTPGRDGGEPRKSTLKLKVEGEKLTGKLSTPARQGGEARETEITEGKVKADEVSFTVVREFNGNKMTSKYSGKVAGDVLKGKIEFERNGEKQSRDWEAKREVEKK